MSSDSTISRRSLAKAALLGTAALVAPKVLAQAAQSPTASDAQIAAAEKNLSKPMKDEAKKLLKGAVENNLSNSESRKKFKLVDCSEPATAYHAIGFEKGGVK